MSLVSGYRKLLQHRVIRNVIVLYSVQITGYVLPLITLPYLSRVLGPGNFGLMALGAAFAQYFVVVTEYGFGVTATRRVAICSQDAGAVSRVFSTIMTWKAAFTAAGFLVLAAIVFATPGMRAHWAVYLVSFLVVTGYALSPAWLFQGLQRMKLVAYSDYGAKIICLVLVFVLVREKSDYVLAAAIQSGAFTISGVIGLLLALFVVKVRFVRPAREEARAALVEGWPVFLSLASNVLTTATNIVVLGIVCKPEDVGYFSAASRLLITCNALLNPITTAVYPHISALAARSRDEALQFLRRRLTWLPAAFLLLGVCLFAAAPLAVRVMYGARFAPASTLLRILAAKVFIQALGVYYGGYYMLAFGYEKEWSRIVRWAVCLHFLLMAPMMWLLGPTAGIAASLVLSDAFNTGWFILFYRRTSKSRALSMGANA